jgi:hypothetical protein
MYIKEVNVVSKGIEITYRMLVQGIYDHLEM